MQPRPLQPRQCRSEDNGALSAATCLLLATSTCLFSLANCFLAFSNVCRSAFRWARPAFSTVSYMHCLHACFEQINNLKSHSTSYCPKLRVSPERRASSMHSARTPRSSC